MNAVHSIHDTRGRQHHSDPLPGTRGFNECLIRFADWSRTLRRLPHPEEIQRRFQINRATAYRWLADLKAARGIPS